MTEQGFKGNISIVKADNNRKGLISAFLKFLENERPKNIATI